MTQIDKDKLLETLIELIKDKDITWPLAFKMYREETGDSIRTCYYAEINIKLQKAAGVNL